jgi:hypothetical protein
MRELNSVMENAARVIGVTSEVFQISGGAYFYVRMLCQHRLINTTLGNAVRSISPRCEAIDQECVYSAIRRA